MAKPTYSIGGLDFATLQKIEAFLNGVTAAPVGTVVGTAAPVPAAPPAPPVPVMPMPTPPAPPTPPTPPTPPAPPIPVAVAPPTPPTPPAPPIPVAVAPPAPPAGGPTQAEVLKAMADAVARCGAGGAGKVGPLMAQYNAETPGVAGTVAKVDPAQYGNLKAALDALQP